MRSWTCITRVILGFLGALVLLPAVALAAPSIAGTCGVSNATSSAGVLTLNYPASIAAGELLIAVVGVDGGLTTTTGWTAAGFTELSDTDQGNTSMSVAYKFASGSESGTFTLSYGGTDDDFHAVICRITGAHDTTPPEVGTAATSASSTLPDCPSLDPSGWATEDTLWFCAFTTAATFTVTVDPASYALVDKSEGVSSNASTYVYSRANSAGSEDPGAATISSATAWVAQTIAVRPSAAPAGGSTIKCIISGSFLAAGAC